VNLAPAPAPAPAPAAAPAIAPAPAPAWPRPAGREEVHGQGVDHWADANPHNLPPITVESMRALEDAARLHVANEIAARLAVDNESRLGARGPNRVEVARGGYARGEMEGEIRTDAQGYIWVQGPNGDFHPTHLSLPAFHAAVAVLPVELQIFLPSAPPHETHEATDGLRRRRLGTAAPGGSVD
jgi:hypothetical protein